MLKLLKLGTARFAGTASFIKMPPLKKLAGRTSTGVREVPYLVTPPSDFGIDLS